ncbi:hypothetical protein ACFB49_48570 [Sphingomonas sp. DBB INV C78]|uniref:DUF3313 domain-containing protein n=1 Tax=Sphingomonas sp. DBB INV C78 TaxID=3349434 RepID=UPI0036D42F6B
MKSSILIAALLVLPLPALAAQPPAAVPGAAKMKPDAGKESWTYRKDGLNLKSYDKIIIDPTAIYHGKDAQFEDVNAADQAKFAQLVTQSVQEEVAKKMEIARAAGPGTLRLKITLLGAEATKTGVATATRVLPFGMAMNAYKELKGKPGSYTGSLLFAVTLSDAKSGEVLVAAIRRKSPSAMDIPATLSTVDTVKAVAHDIGKEIAEKLDQARGR